MTEFRFEVIRSDTGKYHFVKSEQAWDIVEPRFTLCGLDIRTGYWGKVEMLPERAIDSLSVRGRMCKRCMRVPEWEGEA